MWVNPLGAWVSPGDASAVLADAAWPNAVAGAFWWEAVGRCSCRKLCWPGAPSLSVSRGQSPAACGFPALPVGRQGECLQLSGAAEGLHFPWTGLVFQPAVDLPPAWGLRKEGPGAPHHGPHACTLPGLCHVCPAEHSAGVVLPQAPVVGDVWFKVYFADGDGALLLTLGAYAAVGNNGAETRPCTLCNGPAVLHKGAETCSGNIYPFARFSIRAVHSQRAPSARRGCVGYGCSSWKAVTDQAQKRGWDRRW